jgi:chromosome segregation ATPase
VKLLNVKQHSILEKQSKQIEMLKQQMDKRESTITEMRGKDLRAQEVIHAFEEEKQRVTSLLIKKQDENTQLEGIIYTNTDDCNHSKSQISSLKTDLRECMEKLTNIQTTELKTNANFEAHERERESMQQTVNWCNEELQRKNDQFTSYRREKVSVFNAE